MRGTTTWNGLHPRLCLNSSRNRVLHPLHIVTLREVRERELLEFRGAPRHCTGPVQTLSIRFTNSTVSMGSVFHTAFSCPRNPLQCTSSRCSATQSFRRFVSVSSNVHHLALTSETGWSPRWDHQSARTWLRTDVTPDFISWRDSLMSRTLATEHVSVRVCVAVFVVSSVLPHSSLAHRTWLKMFECVWESPDPH